MIYRLEYLKDIIGNNYLGINIPPTAVGPYLSKMEDILGEKYRDYTKCQQDRDRGHFHITVINVMEYNRLASEIGIDKFVNSLESVLDSEIDDIKFMGLGKAEKAGNRAYFVVINSQLLSEIRKKYNLQDQDFHITLGFLHKDVFGVRKNEVLKETEPFLKLLKKLYYNDNETFNFIREISNFEFQNDEDIYPILFEETNATFRVGINDYFTISLIDGELRIVAKWQDSEKKPILSRTLIQKKFKDI